VSNQLAIYHGVVIPHARGTTGRELGRWLLGVTAAGFVAYGFYEIIHARYLHIRRVR
jgi:hypothetical protein